MTKSYYDVVLIGGGLSNLLCGALLAKRGFRVLILGQDEPPPSYPALDFELPREPFTFLGASSPPIRRMLSELALSQVVRRRGQEVTPSFQVSLPGHRFDVTRDEERMTEEIEREFSTVQRPIADFLRVVRETSDGLDAMLDCDVVWPPSSFLERRAVHRLRPPEFLRDPLSELPDGHPFRAAARAPVCFASNAEADLLEPLPALRLFDSWWRRPLALDGGYAWLAAQLAVKAETYTGEIRLKERCDRVRVKRGAVSGVRIAGSGEEIGCSFVIFGQNLHRLLRLVPRRTLFEGTLERWGEPQTRYYRYSLHLVVREEAIPPGLKRELFLIRNPRRRLFADNLLRIVQEPIEPEGHRCLSVEALLPRRDVEDVPGHLFATRERILSALERLLPFLRPHLVVMDSPHDGRDIQRLDKRQLVTPPDRLMRGPHTMRTVSTFPVWRAFGLCALAPQTPIRNLLLCNTEVMPTLGTEGLFLSAWSAARLVTKSDRAKTWMRRGRWTKVEL